MATYKLTVSYPGHPDVTTFFTIPEEEDPAPHAKDVEEQIVQAIESYTERLSDAYSSKLERQHL